LDDEKTIKCKPFFVTFANSSQFGYNAEISPKASVQDGLLDVCIFKKPNIIEVPIVATYFIAKQIDKSNFIEIHKAKKISVIREIEDVVNIDGEAMQMSKDITVEINPLSLNILLNK
jgi:diacylglycerol kinase family enzyme